MKKITPILLWALLIFSCAPLQNIQEGKGQIPVIGSIANEKKSLLGSEVHCIGKPHMIHALALSIREIPFTKSTYRTYQNRKIHNEEKGAVHYVDSLTVKPKYITLEISDRIALQTLLNHSDNSDVRSYLIKDEDYSVVSGITMVVNPELRRDFMASEALFLTETEHGVLGIALMNNKETVTIPLPKAGIFDYKLSGFCWGENRYGEKQIEAIVSYGDRCPEGTEKDAHKLNATKNYLKL